MLVKSTIHSLFVTISPPKYLLSPYQLYVILKKNLLHPIITDHMAIDVCETTHLDMGNPLMATATPKLN